MKERDEFDTRSMVVKGLFDPRKVGTLKQPTRKKLVYTDRVEETDRSFRSKRF